jgi:hypothetical protein
VYKYIILILLCFSSCVPSKNISEPFLQKILVDCINIIGNDVPNTFLYEAEYTKTIEETHENPEVLIELVVNSGLVESCDIIFSLSDFLDARQYYNQLLVYLKDENWNFIQFISKYKRPKGELYSKNGIYFGIYEPTPLTIPIRVSEDIGLNNFYESPSEMIFDMDYYKSKIIGYRDFFDNRQQISTIIEIDNIIPGFLCFLVCWDDNLKGYMYELYTFDKNQNITNKYLVGYGPNLKNYRNILMERLTGTKIEQEIIAFGYYNNDGINEILSYSFYPNIGYVFTVFGYSIIENEFIDICLVPIFINFDKPFSPVEYIGNGFRILEILDDEYLELKWNEYIWDMDTIKYTRK